MGTAGRGQAIRDAGDTTTINQDLRAAHSTLDPGRTKTGILLNQVVPYSKPKDFTGSGRQKANSIDNWLMQYNEYYQAHFDRSGLPSPDSVSRKLRRRLRNNPNQLVLVLLSYQYDEFRANAMSSGMIRVDSAAGRLYDEYPPVEGGNGNLEVSVPTPYEQHQFFAVALAGTLPSSGVGSVYVGDEFYYGTDDKPTSLSVDFNDGKGVQPISVNTTVAVDYSAVTQRNGPARKPGEAAARTSSLIRTYGEATVVFPNPVITGTATIPGTYLMPLGDQPDAAIGLVAGTQWNGEPKARGVAWVKWGVGNTSYPSGQPEKGQFRKPLIFVEGIDFGCDESMKSFCYSIQPNRTALLSRQFLIDLSAVDHSTFRNGSVGWNEMVQYNEDDEAVEKLPDLRTQLLNAGYDLIFLDYSDGATFIQSNAMVLVELLNYINANRTADAEETVVTAASMGGQVARYALSYMEENNQCHNSKLYVSIDSPHRGANIPLGIQALIVRLRDTWTGAAFKPQLADLRQPAAEQMLVYHIDDNATGRRAAWQAWQQTPGSYPSLLRKVAIADGNRTGQILQNPSGGSQSGGEELMYNVHPPFSIYSLLTADWGQNVVNALPGASSRGHDNVVFRYQKPYEYFNNWHYTTVPAGTRNYDLAPGGTRHTTADAAKISNGLIVSGSAYQTFIPTISALGISDAGSIYNADVFYNVKVNIPKKENPNPSKYAFEAYYAPDGISEPHINITDGQAYSPHGNPTYTSNNSAWLLNELAQSAHYLPALFDVGTTYQPGTPAAGGRVSPYNFGSLYRRLLPSVQLGYGGELFVNNVNLPNSGGPAGPASTANAPKEANLELYTSSCGSRVVLTYNTSLTLGQPNDSHTATVRIGHRSLVDLGGGSRTVVHAGSVLRIEKGGTLLVRAGSTLTIYGTVIIERDAYVCVQDPASVVVAAGGQFTARPGFRRGANPLLSLPNLPSCDQNFPSCTSTLNLTFAAVSGSRAAGGEAPGFDDGYCTRVFLVTAEGEGFSPPFTWTVANGTASSTVTAVYGRPDQIQLVLRASSPTRTVSVTAHNDCGTQPLQLTQTFTGTFPSCTQGSRSAVAMYPNPAGSTLDFDLPAAASASAAAPPDYEVALYDGQGQLRWRERSSGGKLHLASGSLPRGLYGVVITQDGVISRRTLSLE